MIDEKKLIERLEERKTHLMKDFVLANVVLSSKQKALDRINEIDGAIEIVNQLAEEQNNDVCEWKGEDMLGLYNSSCRQKSIVNPFWTHCPYCGKKIKVIGD